MLKGKIGRKTIVLSIVAIVTLSFVASAAINGFLSNDSKVSASASSPLKMELWDSDEWRQCTADPLNLGELYGGDTITIYGKVTRLGQTDFYLYGAFEAAMTCPDGVTWADFDSLKVIAWGPGYAGGSDHLNEASADVLVDWTNNDDLPPGGSEAWHKIALEIGTVLITDQLYYQYKIEMTFDSHATGDYDLVMQVL